MVDRSVNSICEFFLHFYCAKLSPRGVLQNVDQIQWSLMGGGELFPFWKKPKKKGEVSCKNVCVHNCTVQVQFLDKLNTCTLYNYNTYIESDPQNQGSRIPFHQIEFNIF